MKNKWTPRKFEHPIRKFLLLLITVVIGLTAFGQPTRNKALKLSGSNSDYLLINDSDASKKMEITSRDFTVEMWVKMKEAGNNTCLFYFRTKDNKFSLHYDHDNEFELETKGNAGDHSYNLYMSNNPSFIGNWRHVSLTYDHESQTARLYIDGQKRKVYGVGRDLFPTANNHSGDGTCQIGGSSVDGVDGKMDVAEVRIWQKQMSDSEVLRYYDKEVNNSHPNWNKLIRYYHCSSEYSSGGNIYIEDYSPVHEYDGKTNNSTRTRVADLYPPIRPPNVVSGTYPSSFSASRCSYTNKIRVIWSGLYGSYTTETGVHVSITRNDDNYTNPIYEGDASIFDDVNVQPGTKYSYRIKTFWKVGNVKKYSYNYLQSNEGYTKRHYTGLQNLSATDGRCDGLIRLDWSYSGVNPSKWLIQRADDQAFSQNAVTIGSNYSSTQRYAFNTPPIKEKIYYYRIKAYGRDDNNCDVSASWSNVSSGYGQLPPKSPINFALTVDGNQEDIRVSWNKPVDSYTDEFELRRYKKLDESTEVTFSYTKDEFTHEDLNLLSCETYAYELSAKNECGLTKSDLIQNGTITPNDLTQVMNSFEVSKGYYGDKVRLKWTINTELGNVDYFKIERSLATENNFELLTVLDKSLIYDDFTAHGGKFYKYKVYAETSCNENTITSNEVHDLGFSNPFGVANGHVEYAGGNPVEKVEVKFERAPGNLGKSLHFNGTADSYVKLPNIMENGMSFTMELWMKTEGFVHNSEPILSSSWKHALTRNHDGNSLRFRTSNGFLYGSKNVADAEWHQVTVTYNDVVDSLYMYVDGELDNKIKTNMASGYNYKYFYLGKIASGSYRYNGWMDEVRIWDKFKTVDEVEFDYGRIIKNDEPGLLAYWRMDEGTGSTLYDVSSKGAVFNKNNATLMANVAFSEEVPSSTLLGVLGRTDNNGDYAVDYIPYTQGGELYKAIPMKGQHKFSPNSRTLFVGDGAQSHNGVDFTDISSFEVQGKITYSNSNFPVEGAVILVDGFQAIGTDGNPLRTDVYGNYKLNVPIGKHYISVAKEGHSFEEGIFPPRNEFGDLQYHEFIEPLTVNFQDSTRITIAGRIVGGLREGEKEIGFDYSTNNIGICDVTFRIQKENYDLDVSSSVFDTYSIKTDPKSGEYEIQLIPEKWIIEKAGNDSYYIDPQSLSVLDLTNETSTYNTQKREIESGNVSTYSYNYLLNFIVRETPNIVVVEQNETVFDGDTLILYDQADSEEKDSVLIKNGDLDYPVFQMGKDYTTDISVYETYLNPTHPDGEVKDEVPVLGANVTIINNLPFSTETPEIRTDSTGQFSYSFRAGGPNLSNQEEGAYTKTFEVVANIGERSVIWRDNNLFRGYVLGAEIIEGTDFVTFGPEVVDFVLRDPPGSNSYAFIEKGSKYTRKQTWALDRGSDYSMDDITVSGMKTEIGGGTVGPVIETEIITETETGLKISREYDTDGHYSETIEFTEKIETSNDKKYVGSMADLFIGKAHNAYFSKTKNLRFMEEDYVNQHGLIRVGKAVDGKIMTIMNGYANAESETSTYFIYSQEHILTQLIPSLITQRNSLLQTSDLYSTDLSIQHRFYGFNNDHPSLEDWKKDSLIANSSADVSVISYQFSGTSDQIDSVYFINEQITLWSNALMTNEAEKASAEHIDNISIDGSTGAFTREISQNFGGKYNWESAREWTFQMNSEFRSTVNKAGAKLKSKWQISGNQSIGVEKESGQSVKFGFVIDERDRGDYYSIDVKTNKGVGLYNSTNFANHVMSDGDFRSQFGKQIGISAGMALGGKLIAKALSKTNPGAAKIQFTIDAASFMFETANLWTQHTGVRDDAASANAFDVSGFNISSPVFSIKGGQSKCPHEGEEFTSFYLNASNESHLLHTATLQVERPVINAEPTIRLNVPEAEEAQFTLVLGNESESNSVVWYDITIDGISPNRSFLVPAFETVRKTLSIRKGKPDVMRYDSIAIIFHSSCQFNPTSSNVVSLADTVYVSVEFQPQCSEVEVLNLNENWVANYNNDDELLLELGSYDINHEKLEKLDLQYKSLSGSPIVIEAFFKDTTGEYSSYTGVKQKIDGAAKVQSIWNLKGLTDRVYQVRARAHCFDGSVIETPYIQGTIDRSTPRVFGKPQPSDERLTAQDDISLLFNEAIESGLVREHNIEVKAVLNGAKISHGSFAQFDLSSEYGKIPSVHLQQKSFTIEFWMKREVGTSGIVFETGNAGNRIQMDVLANGAGRVRLGGQVFAFDPSPAYTIEYPEEAWHHWAVAFDQENQELSVYADDQVLFFQTDIQFKKGTTADFFVGKTIEMGIHELRIWEITKSLGDVYSSMSTTLAGNELGLYGYWPLNDGKGDFARDYAGSRDLKVNGIWTIEPKGYHYESKKPTQFARFSGANVTIDNNTDFTIEMWFKQTQESVDTVCLLSSGKADGKSVFTNPEGELAIAMNPNGTLSLLSNGFKMSAGDGDYNNGNWHHFALVVNRKSIASCYVDGELTSQVKSDSIGAFYGAKISLGARAYQLDPVTISADQFFENGQLDEVRIWKTARSQSLLERYENHKLIGNEQGLLAYFPFEAYRNVMGSTLIEFSEADQLQSEELQSVGTVEKNVSMSIEGNTPPVIQDVRPLQLIPFQYTVSEDGIVIEPMIDPTRIEGQTLEISVRDILDLYGNRLASPITWLAHVDQNQLIWKDNEIEQSATVGDDVSFNLEIVNRSGSSKAYLIDQLPSWLELTEGSGSVSANQSLFVEATVSKGLSIGDYEHNLILKGVDDYEEVLTVKLRLETVGPDWELDENAFNYSMNLVAMLEIGEVISQDNRDLVGAFINGVCVGKSQLEYVSGTDQYQAFVNIYSNTVAGDSVYFELWDASTGTHYTDVTPSITFENNTIIGNPIDPIVLKASESRSREVHLKKGWNWVSFNLDHSNLSTVETTLSQIGTVGDVIKSQSTLDQRSATGWFGTITSNGGLVPENMYSLSVNENEILTLKGVPFDLSQTTISIDSGWNQIGFVPQEAMKVEEALASVQPNDGDVIKSQSSFAIYSNASIGWIGSLNYLSPSEGYKYFTTNASVRTLQYPETSSLGGPKKSGNEREIPQHLVVNPHEFPSNGTLVAELYLNGEVLSNKDYFLLAMNEVKIQGVQSSSTIQNKELFFLTIHGDASLEKVSFQVFDSETNQYLEVEETISFTMNRREGTVEKPIQLHLKSDVKREEAKWRVYPNPFEDELFLDLSTSGESVEVRLTDLSGKLILQNKWQSAPSTFDWKELKNISSGTYLMTIKSATINTTIKLIKK